MIIQPPMEWFDRVRGIFVNGCVTRGEGSSFRAPAHAHNVTSDPHFGWICFRSIRSIKRIKGLVVACDDGTMGLTGTNRILMHEYAHILTPNHGHDDTWRSAMRKLGQPIVGKYKKMKE